MLKDVVKPSPNVHFVIAVTSGFLAIGAGSQELRTWQVNRGIVLRA